MKTCPHSVHSLSAVKSLLIVGPFKSKTLVCGDCSAISLKAATAFATT
jgi:hypothetical protein